MGVWLVRGPTTPGAQSRVRESTMKPVGKPDARNGHVRFDERGRETGRRSCVSTRARPRLYLRPISIGLSALASLLGRPIEIGRRLKPAPHVGKNVKLLL